MRLPSSSSCAIRRRSLRSASSLLVAGGGILLLFSGCSDPSRENVASTSLDLTAQLTIDNAQPLEPVDLSRYALGQGGLSSTPMIDAHVSDLAQLQPKTIRVFLQEYLNIYPNHGVYDWSKLDAFLSAVVATGARPIANIDFKPAVLYPTINQDIVEPTSYPEWEELIFQLVKHCQSRGFGIQYWEIGNEGDIGESGGCPYHFSPANYLPYYAHTAAAIRRADPSAKVGGPGLASSGSPIGDALIDFGGQGNAPLDFFSWHGYSNDVGGFRGSIQDIQSKLRAYPALAATETLISEWNVDLNSPGLNPYFQPSFIIEMTRMFHEQGLSMSAYYHIRDVHVNQAEFDPFMSPGGASAMAAWWNTHPQYDGIWDFDGTRRASYFVFDWLRQLTGTRVAISGETGEVRAFAARDAKTLRALVWNYSGTGQTYDLTLQLPNVGGGSFSVVKLDAGPPGGVQTVRTGASSELDSAPIQLTMAPFESYFVTVPAGPPDSTSSFPHLFPTEIPADQYNDGVRYELATQFHSSQAGHITQLRFYKPSNGSGDYVMHIWNNSGGLVATVDMGVYAAGDYGWKTVDVAPIPLNADTDTNVALQLPDGSYYYAASPSTLPLSHSPLTAVQGRYGPAGSYPTNVTPHNYFVDVTFSVP